MNSRMSRKCQHSGEEGGRRKRLKNMLLLESEELIPMIQVASDHLKNLQGDDQVQYIDRWLTVCDKALNTLRNNLPIINYSSEKQKCLNLIQQVMCLHAKFETFFKQGAGVSQSKNQTCTGQRKDEIANRVRWADCENAFKCRLQTSIIINLIHKDISAFLEDACILFENYIKRTLHKHGPLKVYGVLNAKFRKYINDEEKIDIKYFNTKSEKIFLATILKEWFHKNIKEPILKQIEEFEERESQWTLHSVTKLEVNINKYNPIRVGTYIDLPSQIKLKNACVNVKNMDEQCFKWAVLSALHPAEQHSYRISKYIMYKDELDLTGIQFPVTLKDVHKFEKQNNISINVYGLCLKNSKFICVPLSLTSEKKNKEDISIC